MNIWVDADNCSVSVRKIIQRAAIRKCIVASFIANVAISLPSSSYLRCVLVAPGSQSTDEYIKAAAQRGDIAVTADIPLAYFLVGEGLSVINPRGDLYTSETIGERKSMRNFMTSLRAAGLRPPAHKRFGKKPSRKFAEQFDKSLTSLAGSPEK